jgi:hypothetical protein
MCTSPLRAKYSKQNNPHFIFAKCQKRSANTLRTNLQLPEAKNLPSELTHEHRSPLLSFSAAFVTPFGGISANKE